MPPLYVSVAPFTPWMLQYKLICNYATVCSLWRLLCTTAPLRQKCYSVDVQPVGIQIQVRVSLRHSAASPAHQICPPPAPQEAQAEAGDVWNCVLQLQQHYWCQCGQMEAQFGIIPSIMNTISVPMLTSHMNVDKPSCPVLLEGFASIYQRYLLSNVSYNLVPHGNICTGKYGW